MATARRRERERKGKGGIERKRKKEFDTLPPHPTPQKGGITGIIRISCYSYNMCSVQRVGGGGGGHTPFLVDEDQYLNMDL